MTTEKQKLELIEIYNKQKEEFEERIQVEKDDYKKLEQEVFWGLNNMPQKTNLLKDLNKALNDTITITFIKPDNTKNINCKYTGTVNRIYDDLSFHGNLKKLAGPDNLSSTVAFVNFSNDNLGNIYQIKDKNGQIILNNEYPYASELIQKGYLLGSNYCLDELKNIKNNIENSIRDYDEKFDKQLETAANLEEYVNAGLKYIYPALAKDWENFIYEKAKNYDYDFKIAKDCIKMLKELDSIKDDSVTSKNVKNLISEHTDSSFAQLANCILYFSPKGPKFYKYNSTAWQDAIQEEYGVNQDLRALREIGETDTPYYKKCQARKDEIEEIINRVIKIEKRNQDFIQNFYE